MHHDAGTISTSPSHTPGALPAPCTPKKKKKTPQPFIHVMIYNPIPANLPVCLNSPTPHPSYLVCSPIRKFKRNSWFVFLLYCSRDKRQSSPKSFESLSIFCSPSILSSRSEELQAYSSCFKKKKKIFLPYPIPSQRLRLRYL